MLPPLRVAVTARERHSLHTKVRCLVKYSAQSCVQQNVSKSIRSIQKAKGMSYISFCSFTNDQIEGRPWLVAAFVQMLPSVNI